MQTRFFIGRLRMGPVPEAYYSPQELADFGARVRRWQWARRNEVGLEVQFCSSMDGRGNNLAGPTKEQIYGTCKQLRNQGHELALHLSSWLIDLFRPNKETEEPIINPNEFFDEFNFNYIIGHFKAHENIWSALSYRNESYNLRGVPLEERFARRICLENGYKRENNITELAIALSEKNVGVPIKAGVCFDIGHLLRSFYDFAWSTDMKRPVYHDSAWRYARRGEEIDMLQSRVTELSGQLDKSKSNFEEERIKKDVLRHFSQPKKVGRETYYLNAGRLADCGKRIRWLHAHSLCRIGTSTIAGKHIPRVADHYPILYSLRYPTPLQNMILTEVIRNAPQLGGLAVEHLKEFNTERWLGMSFKYARRLLPS